MRTAIAFGIALLCSATACTKSGSGDSDQSAHNDRGGSATETNVAGIHCFEDEDCGPGRTCMHYPGQDDGACSGGSSGPFHPGQSDDEDGGTVTGPNTR